MTLMSLSPTEPGQAAPLSANQSFALQSRALDVEQSKTDSGLVAGVASGVFGAVASIGAAFISKDVSKYEIRQKTKSEFMNALVQQKTDIEKTKILTEAQKFFQQEETKRRQIETTGTQGIVSLVAPTVLALGFAAIVATALTAWVASPRTT